MTRDEQIKLLARELYRAKSNIDSDAQRYKRAVALLDQIARHIAESNSVTAEALEPTRVKVKPLVWEDGEYQGCWTAGDYDIWRENNEYELCFWAIVQGNAHKTLAGAQSAAWEHHQARILAAIEY